MDLVNKSKQKLATRKQKILEEKLFKQVLSHNVKVIKELQKEVMILKSEVNTLKLRFN